MNTGVLFSMKAATPSLPSERLRSNIARVSVLAALRGWIGNNVLS